MIFAFGYVIASEATMPTREHIGSVLMAKAGQPSTSSQKGKGDFSIEFGKIFIRTLDSRPVKWLTVKIKNTGQIPLGKQVVRVVDVTNRVDLYGGREGFMGGGFHNNISDYGPSSRRILKPGDEGFISVCIRRPEGPILKIYVTLINEKYAQIVEKSLEFDMIKAQENTLN
jgi:hypothetical protein